MAKFTQNEIQAIEKLRSNLIENANYRNNIVKECPVCGSNVQDRNIALFKELIGKLYKVYVWCGQKRVHEFTMDDIKDMLDKNAYARFGDLVRFGGLVYKPKDDNGNRQKAHYGLNMARCKAFWKKEYKIPVQITLNQITNEIIDAKYVMVDEFPELVKFITDKGVYDYEKDLIKN
jgi:hypothetical protein